MRGASSSSPRAPCDDDETVESLWSNWDFPRRMMQVVLRVKKNRQLKRGTSQHAGDYSKYSEQGGGSQGGIGAGIGNNKGEVGSGAEEVERVSPASWLGEGAKRLARPRRFGGLA